MFPVLLIGVGAALVCILVLGYQSISIAYDKKTYLAPGRLITVNGRRFHLLLQGDGPVTVIMDGGLGQAGLVWSLVQQGLGHSIRVCIVDRAGYGWSDAMPGPRTSEQIVKELSIALQAGEITGPYVLVGHSWGGMNMSLFASLYPSQVAGIVLVDAYNADLYIHDQMLYHRYMLALRRVFRAGAIAASLGLMRLLLHFGIRSILPTFITRQPETVRAALLTGYLSGKNFATAIAENSSLEMSAAYVRTLERPLTIPLTVLTHGQPSMFASLTAPDASRAEEIWQQSQAAMVRRSPLSRLVVAEHSGHDIHVEQPDIVVQAIQTMVSEIVTQTQIY